MSSVVICQSGGVSIVSIPKAIIKTLGLHVGSKLELSIKDDKIILTPEKEEMTLEYLLAESPKVCFQINDEDREWVDALPIGKECM